MQLDSDAPTDPLIVPGRFQGPPQRGHGGWTAYQLARRAGGDRSVRLCAPIPLDTPLVVRRDGERYDLIERGGDQQVLVMQCAPWEPDVPGTDAVGVDEAREARSRWPLTLHDHPNSNCFSCGLTPESMQVHAGPLGDGRYATDWRAPQWAISENGNVDEVAIWSAIDCATAWYVYLDGPRRTVFTVQFAVKLHKALTAGSDYVLVAWRGDYSREWDGRKRGAVAAAFDARGELVAESRSFWVAA